MRTARKTLVRSHHNYGFREVKLTVSKPITSGGKRRLLGTGAKRERLSNDDPGKRTPSTSKGSDEHAGCDNHDDARGAVLLGVQGGTDGGEDEEPDGLPGSTKD